MGSFLIENHAPFVDIVMHAVDRSPEAVVQVLVGDDHIHRHVEAGQGCP
jgi:hypothetical protein